MPIKEGSYYLPPSHELSDVFQLVADEHFAVGKTMEQLRATSWEKVAAAASDFFTAGIAYFANRSQDEYLKEVGTTAWWAVNKKQVLTALVDNMQNTLVQLGVPVHALLSDQFKNDQPYVLFAHSSRGVTISEFAYVLIPPEFIVSAQNNPVEALAATAWICSQVRDMVNGRMDIDEPQMKSRATATEAHFLIQALKENSDLQLSHLYLDVIARYPQGMASLPDDAKYIGNIHTPPPQAEHN